MKGYTKTSDAHECDHRFGENTSIAIGMTQIQRNDGNARINIMSAMVPGSPKIIEKVLISR